MEAGPQTETLPGRRTPMAKPRRRVENSQVARRLLEVSANSKVARYNEVEFRLLARDAQSVAVAGNFNKWNAGKMPLREDGEYWTSKVALPRGRYEYRFVVDGTWMNDPNAMEVAANPFGSINSVPSG